MANKEALKGRIEEAKQRFEKVEVEISRHFNRARELQVEAYQLRVNHLGDITKLKQAKDLDELAENHHECAERLKSNERYIATRELNEILENARLIKVDISQYTKIKEHYEAEKEQLKQSYKQKIEDIDREIENAAWQVEQAQTSLLEFEGNN